MKLGVIIIATGKYTKFLDELLPSIDRFFFKDYPLKIVCLTDKDFQTDVPVVKVAWEHRKWPLATLFKFKAIRNAESMLRDVDIAFYIDADMKVIAPVNDISEVFPTPDKQIGCVLHCGWLDSNRNEIVIDPYEHNPSSLACVTDTKGVPYHQACFFNGFTEPFFKLATKMDENIDKDLEKGIVAVWHDESHLNRWFIDNPPKTIPRTYARPLAMGDLLPGTKIVSILKDNEAVR